MRGRYRIWDHASIESKAGLLIVRNAVYCLLIICLYCTSAYSFANKKAQSESLIRAAVVFGILRFVGWPEHNQPEDVINLCEFGNSAAAGAIRSLNGSKKVGTLNVAVISEDDVNGQANCHALLIGKNVSSLPVEKNAVLAFCDNCEDEYRDSASVVLRRNENLVQFEVNLDHLEEQDIRLSASVIELASKCYSSNPSIKGCSNE